MTSAGNAYTLLVLVLVLSWQWRPKSIAISDDNDDDNCAAVTIFENEPAEYLILLVLL